MAPDNMNDVSSEESLGIVLNIHVSFQGQELLWIHPEGSIGGMSSIINFRKDSREQSKLTLEVLQKTYELFYSGQYKFLY
jgi:hypothetical protein